MASSSHSSHDRKNHAYLYAHVKNVSSIIHHNHVVFPTHHDAIFDSHAMFASSSSLYAHGRNRPRCHVHHVASHAPRITSYALPESEALPSVGLFAESRTRQSPALGNELIYRV
jgi:hypothetical protein